MKKLLFFVSGLVFSSGLHAQNLNWAFTNLPNTGGQTQDLKLDSHHHLYTACTFYNFFDPDGSLPSPPLPGVGAYDSYLGKYSLSGNYVWGFVLGGSGDDVVNAITVDHSDNLYVTGSYYDTLDCDPSATVHLIYPWPTNFAEQVFVAKYDSSGNYAWAGSINSKQDVVSCDIQYSSNGYIYVSGVIKDTTDFDLGPGTYMVNHPGFAGFMAKYNLNGQLISVKLLDGPYGYCVVKSMAIDDNLNLLITGQNGDSIDMDPGPATHFIHSHPLSNDVFVASYDSSGNYKWAFSFGGSLINDLAKSIDVDHSGNCYVTGLFYDTVDVDPGPGVHQLIATGTDQDIYLASYDANGNLRWGKSIYGYSLEGPGDVKVSPGGKLYVTGSFTSRLNFDTTQTGFILDNSPSSTQDAFVARYDTSGNFRHAFNIGGLSPDAGYELAIGPSEENIVGGFFRDSVNFQLGALRDKRNGGMNGAVYFASYSECSVPPVNALDSICYGQNYPFGYLSLDTSGLYVQVLKNRTGCDSVVTLNLLEHPLPSISAFASDSAVCAGDTILVWATGEPNHNWGIPGIADSVRFIPGVTSLYIAEATNSYGCVNYSSVQVTVNPLPAVPQIFLSGGDTLFIVVFGASYEWFLEGVPLSNSNNFHITATVTGNYSVTVTNNFGCSSTSTAYFFVPAGMHELHADRGTVIYPNPVRDLLYIHGSGHSEKLIRLLSIEGIVLMERILTDDLIMDMNGFATGIYLLQDGNTITRIIKL